MNVGGILKSPNLTSYYKTFSGASTGAVNNISTTAFNLSTFDANYTTALGGQGITVVPGVYMIVMKVTFGMPTTGTGTSYAVLQLNIAGTNSSITPGGYQLTGYNGWPTNNGVEMQLTSIFYAPTTGSTVQPAFYNNMGGTITNASVLLVLSQMRAF